MIGFTVIGGYLGTGKTTLLNHLLRHNAGRRFALLINDFGDINIDGELIESQTENQINLANGCVCCTLTDGFHEAIDKLMQASPPPEHIIVEASGVANVANLAQYGYGNNLQLDGIVVVADAETVIEKANDKYVAQTVRRQLSAADIVVLNKTDLVDGKTLGDVVDWLSKEVGDIRVVPAVRGNLPISMLLGIQRKELSKTVHSHDHEEYASWSIQADGLLEEQKINAFLHSLGTDVIRAKGLLALTGGGSLEVQLVGRRIDTCRTETVLSPHCQLVAIGLKEQLQLGELDRLAQQYLGVMS
jgi:G3E family GTPase